MLRAGLRKVSGSIVAATDHARHKPEAALRRELQERATREAADVVQNEMPEALFCGTRFVNLEYALTHRRPGLILEFGVAGGKSINHLARLCQDERLYGFDSFQGLPEHWAGNRFSYRNFSQKGVMPSVPPNVELIAGWFNETLPGFLEKHPEQVGFLHVDCDIYSSTQYVLATLKERLGPGCVIVFDEFFNYPGWRQHEYRAFHKFIAEAGRKHTFVSYCGQQAAVVLD
jgi:predicted O-methyltransferase YrrM